VTTFYVHVPLYYYDRLTGARRWKIVEVQIVEVQLSDSDSSTGNKSNKSPPHKEKGTQKEVGSSEATNEECYKGQRLLSFFEDKKINWYVMIERIVFIL
jgi:hypothetical protein